MAKDRAAAATRLSEALLRQKKERGRGGELYADGFVFYFENKNINNYEGNVIVYFNMRPKGTDKLYERRLTLQCPNGQWTVVDYPPARHTQN
jgi:hypothetical protein